MRLSSTVFCVLLSAANQSTPKSGHRFMSYSWEPTEIPCFNHQETHTQSNFFFPTASESCHRSSCNNNSDSSVSESGTVSWGPTPVHAVQLHGSTTVFCANWSSATVPCCYRICSATYNGEILILRLHMRILLNCIFWSNVMWRFIFSWSDSIPDTSMCQACVVMFSWATRVPLCRCDGNPALNEKAPFWWSDFPDFAEHWKHLGWLWFWVCFTWSKMLCALDKTVDLSTQFSTSTSLKQNPEEENGTRPIQQELFCKLESWKNIYSFVLNHHNCIHVR